MTDRGRGFGVSVLGLRLVLVGDSAAVVEALDRYVLPWLPRTATDGKGADRLVEVRRAGAGAELEIVMDGAVVATAPSPEAAIPAVQRALDDAVVHGQREVAVVHAGVVGHAGRAIVLPGTTGAGKSTLVAELVRRGACYYSDEYALIDSGGLVRAYPRPLLLREGPGEGRPVLATELGGTVGREPIAVGLILELRYAASAALALEPVPQGDGVLMLLRNTPQILADQPWILAPLEHAAGRAACYTGMRGEAGEAVAGLLRLAASRT